MSVIIEQIQNRIRVGYQRTFADLSPGFDETKALEDICCLVNHIATLQRELSRAAEVIERQERDLIRTEETIDLLENHQEVKGVVQGLREQLEMAQRELSETKAINKRLLDESQEDLESTERQLGELNDQLTVAHADNEKMRELLTAKAQQLRKDSAAAEIEGDLSAPSDEQLYTAVTIETFLEHLPPHPGSAMVERVKWLEEGLEHVRNTIRRRLKDYGWKDWSPDIVECLAKACDDYLSREPNG